MSRGGARWGAGRPAYKVKAEVVQRLDVRQWARRGLLVGFAGFTWSWQRGGEPAGSIGVVVDSGQSLTLRYATTASGARRYVVQRVELLATGCHLGGARHWFACPCCGRRVALLYLRWGRFACRHCQRVAYASQSEDELGRLWRKQAKIEARLGEYWRRPKGMRQRTYVRLLAVATECESRREQALELLCADFLGRASSGMCASR